MELSSYVDDMRPDHKNVNSRPELSLLSGIKTGLFIRRIKLFIVECDADDRI
jgi:hypothetical protein